MTKLEIDVLSNITEWTVEAAQYAKNHLNQISDIEEKSGEYDLVTSLDKNIQKIFNKHIQEKYPDATIIGEENFDKNYSDIDKGLTFFVDPIDGTLNLVKKHDCFAVMVGVLYNGESLCSAIIDVMNDKLYWGGIATGVYCNDIKLNAAQDSPLKNGLIGVSWRQFLKNSFSEINIAKHSAGARVMGSAGLEFIEIITGKHIAYIATLMPWDIVPGKILVESLGYKITNVRGNKINLKKSNNIIVANELAYKDIRKLQMRG
ncbi:inositol monophosphatase family protein [Lactobacillus terrae]|uniref:inositol monophosphatase family protein n=1 Tax=Lactobacillus terrae TaxID=2269374 RepID=UPI000C1B616E|nr:inositol monophosphatase family protein [Lactobacillus terrae]